MGGERENKGESGGIANRAPVVLSAKWVDILKKRIFHDELLSMYRKHSLIQSICPRKGEIEVKYLEAYMYSTV